jgi:hypothetical protein
VPISKFYQTFRRTVRTVASEPRISTQVLVTKMHTTRSSEMRQSVTTFRLDITILETWLSLDIAVKTLNCLYTGAGKSRLTVVSTLNREFILYYLFIIILFICIIYLLFFCFFSSYYYYFVSLLMIYLSGNVG